MPADIEQYRARRDQPFKEPTVLGFCITIGERR